ncbi:hypothetical protein LGV61_08595 [Desulfurispirillum indicum]|uniref:hypothetical protein n=1 Tax=Desulfurispirillum indicum TaxID=936456 RepID=UPI001CF985B2|nr:hypothetical protein [Desulfurispirillum indicum]UCZ55781.1 hypothetical protein LGV61_08595 [Desulfurispirillum indicum]
MLISNQSHISSALSTYRSAATAADVVKAAGTKEKISQQDNVTISKEAKSLAIFADGQSGSRELAPLPQSLSISDIRQEAAELSDTLTTQMRGLFLRGGIDMSQPFELTTDPSGNVRVSGEHPDKDAIEKLFRENPDLSNSFRKLSSLQTLIAKAKQAQEFQDAYRKNPTEALNRFAWLFEEGEAHYSMEFDGFDVTQRVNWQGQSGSSKLLMAQVSSALT